MAKSKKLFFGFNALSYDCYIDYKIYWHCIKRCCSFSIDGDRAMCRRIAFTIGRVSTISIALPFEPWSGKIRFRDLNAIGQSKNVRSKSNLKSTDFCSRRQSEYPHFLYVLAIDDEFRERIAF